MIDAQPVVFPVPVHELNTALVDFAVPVEAARHLLPGTAFELAEPEPGVARVHLAAHDYRRGAWGAAAAIEVALAAHPVGRPERTGVYLCDAPVSDGFVREVARRAMGTSKQVEPVEVDTSDTDVTFRLSCRGKAGLTLRLPRVTGAGKHVRLDLLGYSYLDDEPYVTHLQTDVPVAPVDPAAVELTVGTGWFADTLRSLGLPRRPDGCTWGEGLTAVYHLPMPLAKAGPDEAGPQPPCFAPGGQPIRASTPTDT